MAEEAVMPANLKKREVVKMQRILSSTKPMGLTMAGAVLGMFAAVAAVASALFG